LRSQLHIELQHPIALGATPRHEAATISNLSAPTMRFLP
jgi:hypothetical protein